MQESLTVVEDALEVIRAFFPIDLGLVSVRVCLDPLKIVSSLDSARLQSVFIELFSVTFVLSTAAFVDELSHCGLVEFNVLAAFLVALSGSILVIAR